MNTRALAASALESVTSDGKALTAALEQTLPRIPQDNDRAFVQALCFGVLRQYGRLNFILRQLASKPIRDEQIRLLALIGLYQLEYTRVKPYAAVAETVSAAGRKSWARPLLNGILRTYQRERERLWALSDHDEEARLGHPAWLIERIRGDWPDACEAIFREANAQAPLALRVNPRQIDRDGYLARLRAAGMNAEPSPHAPYGVILEDAVPVEQLPGFAEGQVSVQDVATQLATQLLNIAPGQRVLDVCAAPGGKTCAMLEAHPQCEVVALDIAPERVAKIRQNLERTGLHASVLTGDAMEPARWWDGKAFDRILLDAPCSATGVIRRHPDIKWLRQAGDIANLAHIQLRLLQAVWPLLAPGGLLLYATCSLLRQENGGPIAAFLASHPEAREVAIDAPWGHALTHGRQILTGEHGMDGFYYARLVRG